MQVRIDSFQSEVTPPEASMDSVRLLLKPQVKESAVLKLGARNTEWISTNYTADITDRSYTTTWPSKDRKTNVTYVRDHTRNISYYIIAGSDIHTTVATIRQRLPVCESRDRGVDSICAHASRKNRRCVSAAVAAATERESVLLDFLSRATQDTSDEVRVAAIDASLIVRWRDLQAPLAGC